MYYLQSRYYNPTWGSFINADALVSTGQGILGNNMFAYCANNPASFSDPTGMCPLCMADGTSDQIMTTVDEGCGGGGDTGVGSFSTSIASVASSTVTISLVERVWFYVKTAIINQKNMDKTVQEILQTKQGRIRQAPLPPGGPNWDDILQKTLKEIKELAKKNAKGYKEIYKLLTDGRCNR